MADQGVILSFITSLAETNELQPGEQLRVDLSEDGKRLHVECSRRSDGVRLGASRMIPVEDLDHVFGFLVSDDLWKALRR